MLCLSDEEENWIKTFAVPKFDVSIYWYAEVEIHVAGLVYLYLFYK